MIITIDGPTASGKSTVAKLLANRLNFVHLNSGLLYRGLAYILVHFFKYTEAQLASPKQCDLDQIVTSLQYSYTQGQPKIFYHEQDITRDLKTKEIDNYASISSAVPQVRASLMAIQRKIGEQQDVVAEGRDTGTIVFPQAELKIFLTASLDVRARRWQSFMHHQGKDYSLLESIRLVDERDQRDINRQIAPLVPATGAVIIDSSTIDINTVIVQVCGLLGRMKTL